MLRYTALHGKLVAIAGRSGVVVSGVVMIVVVVVVVVVVGFIVVIVRFVVVIVVIVRAAIDGGRLFLRNFSKQFLGFVFGHDRCPRNNK